MASTKKNEFSLLKQRADKYALTVSQRFSKAVNDILALQKEYSLEEGEVFSFDDNPRIARQVQDILRELHSATETAIHNGIKLEWKNANDAIDSLLESRMGKEAMHDATFAGWMARDNEARDAFMKRRVAGMSLSDRIWRTEKQLRTEMELALSVSIGEGKSASEISREVRNYLQEPDRLFRRVRMSDGSMRLSRAAAAYHPGQGIYRSSYKNAMRLARTETNMAYRAADFERWKRLDFVTGVRIGLSGSHPDYDVCDRLRGDYPKDFKFSGWHPNCFCNAVPITVSDDDFVKMQQAMLAGEDYDVSSQMVKDAPDGFDEWAKENKDRIIQARKNGTNPYFVRDNEKYVRIALGEEPRPRLMSAPAPTIIPEPGNKPEPGRSTLGAEFPDFKPQIAKSIDEAQDILRKYCEPNPMDRTFKGEVSLKGISLENANEISTAIQRLYESMDIGKISGIKVIDGNSATGKKIFSSSESVACYVPTSKGIYINKAILKDKATFDAYLKRSADAFETVKKNLDKLSPIQRKVAEKYIAAGRELVDDSIQGLITHEMGHHVLGPMTMPVKLFNGVGVNIDKIALKLSGYASTNKTEYLAESFVSWMKGEKVIDQNIQAYLDGLKMSSPGEAGVAKGLTTKKAEDIVIGKLAKEKFELFPASAPSDRGDLIAKMRVLFKENGLSFKNGVDISTVSSPTLAGVYAKYVKIHNASIKRYEKAYTKAEAILGKVGSSIHPAAKEQYAKFVEEFNAALASGEFVDKDNLISGILNLDKLIKEGVDFAKVSTKMPVELLEGKGWLLSGDSLNKRFFDNITGYVPVNVAKTGGTAFSPWKKMVTLNTTDPRYTSKFFRESTVYHEYGHAIDGTSKMFATKDIDDLMAKWLAEFSKNSSDIEKKIDDLRRNKVAGSQEKTPLSMFAKAIDTIQSVTKGKHGGLKYGGHSISYWAGPGHCRNEFIAHMSEFANLDNPIAKDLLGDLYDEMRTLCRKLYGY